MSMYLVGRSFGPLLRNPHGNIDHLLHRIAIIGVGRARQNHVVVYWRKLDISV